MLTAPAPAPGYDQIVHRQQCLDQAARCRRLAYAVSDREAANALLVLAEDYERDAWNARQVGAAI